MSELRTALVLVGVLILAGILAWSLRSRIAVSLGAVVARIRDVLPARRAGHARRKTSRRAAHLARHDALTRDFASRTDRVAAAPLGPDLSVVDEDEEQFGAADPDDVLLAPALPESREPTRAAPEPIDPGVAARDIDFCATLPGGAAVTRDQALGVYRQHEFELDKPHRIFGRCDSSGEWCDLEREHETGMYRDVALTIQLADRDGPVSQSDLTRFSSLVLQMAETLTRRFQFSSTVEEALEQAGHLDTLCREYDLLAVLNIVAPEGAPFAGPEIDVCARAFGLQPDNLKIYQRPNPEHAGSGRLYALANLYQPGFFEPSTLADLSTSGLTLFMRLAGTRHPAEVFLEMAETANSIARCLGGELVDQNHYVLDAHSVERLAGEIAQYAEALEVEGVTPGGKVAARLF